MSAPGDGTLKAILGPTNTGKTHLAIERMCAHSSGVIGFPLRLLAREVYDRVGGNEEVTAGVRNRLPPTALTLSLSKRPSLRQAQGERHE